MSKISYLNDKLFRKRCANGKAQTFAQRFAIAEVQAEQDALDSYNRRNAGTNSVDDNGELLCNVTQ